MIMRAMIAIITVLVSPGRVLLLVPFPPPGERRRILNISRTLSTSESCDQLVLMLRPRRASGSCVGSAARLRFSSGSGGE